MTCENEVFWNFEFLCRQCNTFFFFFFFFQGINRKLITFQKSIIRPILPKWSRNFDIQRSVGINKKIQLFFCMDLGKYCRHCKKNFFFVKIFENGFLYHHFEKSKSSISQKKKLNFFFFLYHLEKKKEKKFLLRKISLKYLPKRI